MKNHDLASLVQTSVGLRLREQDHASVQAWVDQRLDAHGLADHDAYLCLLQDRGEAGRQERERLTARLTTGETYFLRDPEQFRLLSQQLLPQLIERAAFTRKLRLWSAGCSTGEEAFTLAMLVHELLPRRDDWSIDIVATDINTRALDIARAGRYGDWSFRTIDESRRRRYFARDGKDWVLEPDLRRMVRFLHSDLVADPIPDAASGLCDADLIMCRNVFIYMQPAAVAQVAGKLTAVLADGGYLVTGHGELLGHNTHGLHTRVFAASVVMHKQDEPVATTDARAGARDPRAPELPAKPVAAATTARPPSRPATTRAPRPADRPLPAAPAARDLRAEFDAVMALAWRQADSGLANEAERSCRAATDLVPFDPWPYYLRAQLAQERGDARDARQLLDKAIYLEPSLVAAYIELSALLEQEGKHERAKQMLLTAARELTRLPADALIKPYENSSAADVLAYLDSRLSGAAA